MAGPYRGGSVEILPNTIGYRIEDGDGNLVGVLLNTANGTSWVMDSDNLWPDEDLTMTVVATQQQLQFPTNTTTYTAADSFATDPTAGDPAPAVAADRRYLVRNGGTVVAFIAVEPGGATVVLEYGHPAPDDRLPDDGGARYFPAATLVLEVRAAGYTPTWGSHRPVN